MCWYEFCHFVNFFLQMWDIISFVGSWWDKIVIFAIGGDSKESNIEQHTTFETITGDEGRWAKR